MSKLTQTKQQINWADWTKLKNPIWYKRITQAMPIYNDFNQECDKMFSKLGGVGKLKQLQLLKSFNKMMLDVCKKVDAIDATFVAELYQTRLMYKAHEKGFDSEKFSTLMKESITPPKGKRKKVTRIKKLGAKGKHGKPVS